MFLWSTLKAIYVTTLVFFKYLLNELVEHETPQDLLKGKKMNNTFILSSILFIGIQGRPN